MDLHGSQFCNQGGLVGLAVYDLSIQDKCLAEIRTMYLPGHSICEHRALYPEER